MLATLTTTAASLHEAELAYATGFQTAAAVLCRAALEAHLRILCEENAISCPKRLPLRGIVDRLLSRNVIDAEGALRCKLIRIVGGNAAHGRAVDWQEIASILDDLNVFLGRYPVGSNRSTGTTKLVS